MYGCTGSIFLHSIPTCRPYLDDPPSISEGWGGRITDYRISVSSFANYYYTWEWVNEYLIAKDLSELVLENLLYPSPVDRTKIPTIFPIQKGQSITCCPSMAFTTDFIHTAIAKLEHDTRYWPLVYNDTILYTLKQVLLAVSNLYHSKFNGILYLGIDPSAWFGEASRFIGCGVGGMS